MNVFISGLLENWIDNIPGNWKCVSIYGLLEHWIDNIPGNWKLSISGLLENWIDNIPSWKWMYLYLVF